MMHWIATILVVSFVMSGFNSISKRTKKIYYYTNEDWHNLEKYLNSRKLLNRAKRFITRRAR